jgi:hypothetical protein
MIVFHKAPDDKRVAFTQEFFHLSQSGPLGHRAADPIDDDFLAARLLQGILLQVQILIVGGDSGISDVHNASDKTLNNLWGMPRYLTIVSLLRLLPEFEGESNPK